jgi:hypothetical protein
MIRVQEISDKIRVQEISDKITSDQSRFCEGTNALSLHLGSD